MKVIQQYPHPYTPAGCSDHAAQQSFAAGIGMNGVVLQVQGFLGVFYESQAAAVCLLGAAEQEETGVMACTRITTLFVDYFE